ncbi:MAG: DUF2283 domain-containing protein [Caldilineaceae bacterium]|nr:DUF2283 domain-containing protein [Caldilineaceae bacterium]
MSEIKVNYDEDADVLYISFGRGEHVMGVVLTENVLLRLDTGKATGVPPRAVGLTFISYERMMARRQHQPISVSLVNLRHLPEDLWRAVLDVLTTPPVSDFLTVNLSLNPQTPPLPKLVSA